MKLTVKLDGFEAVFEAESIHQIASEVNDLFALILALREDYSTLFAPAVQPSARSAWSGRAVPTQRQAPARPAIGARRQAAGRVGEIVEEVTAIVTEPNGRVKFKTPSLSRYGVLLTESTSIEPAVQALIPSAGEQAVAGVRVSHDGKVALSVFAE